ncbi:MAG TPA: hypothetical protein VHZ78_11140 [Rhizomicrobium sp.]|jgi:hypothetical protein|nr:hypothetical protein [Rhizomicrobium sp.]
MRFNNAMRQTHRWLSVLFVAAFIATSVALAQKSTIPWVPYMPLPPLFLLAVTGIYLFVLPYVMRRR